MPGSLWQWFYLGFSPHPLVMNSFSDEELSLMGNAEVLLMKRQVIRKVSDDFSRLESDFKGILENTPGLKLPEGTLQKAGKISRGENYKGLPYLVLDYPRLMNNEQILNIRLLFWWGHYYSMSLHLAGEAWHQYKSQVISKIASRSSHKQFIQYRGSPWEHDVSLPFFTSMENVGTDKLKELEKAHFFRIVNLLPLKGVEEMEYFAKSTFEKFTSMLQA